MLLVCHMTPHDHLIKGSYDLVAGGPSPTEHAAKFAGHKSCESGGIVFHFVT